ncbi:MAG: biopolymer transporter ExbD [Gammaproteobacteria bacterium]|nr:biopolymer transporter ExbD [Gammaproteobacteria bacterium]MCW8923509.1 biopolymer transporter ExbD [Gammaproteobacteria bacterium]
MSRRRSRAGNKTKVVDLDVTAFMNLMVVLVPFLLMMAVFANMSILDFKLPSDEEIKSSGDDKKEFGLNVVIFENELLVTNQNGGVIKKIPKSQSGHNFHLLNQTLRLVKTKYPDLTAIAILLEPDTHYDHLIRAMDTVREYRALYQGEIVNAELFPDISIGDAPKDNLKN